MACLPTARSEVTFLAAWIVDWDIPSPDDACNIAADLSQCVRPLSQLQLTDLYHSYIGGGGHMLTARCLRLLHVLSQRHAHGAAAEVPPHLHNALDMLKRAAVDLIQVSGQARDNKQKRTPCATLYLHLEAVRGCTKCVKVEACHLCIFGSAAQSLQLQVRGYPHLLAVADLMSFDFK